MPQATQSYPQYNASACTSCEACLNNCPPDCIYFDPLFIMSDECILCEQCIPECPEGDGVVFARSSKLLGKEWQWFVQPPASETTPSNPSESESSTGKKDNEQESSQNPSQKPNKDNSNKEDSKGESQGDSSYTPTDKAKLEALKNTLLSAPPPYKIQSSAKVINAINSLKRYISTMS